MIRALRPPKRRKAVRIFLKTVAIAATFIAGLDGDVLDFQIKIKRARANTLVRQEINIIDGYLGSGSGVYATSSAIVNLDSTKYTSGTYYFEVVASTTAATNATVSLVNATSSQVVTSITVNGTSYARYRSTAFTAPGLATNYVVKLGNESVQKGLLAARIVVLQNAATLTSTQTQIEIGDEEEYTSTATSTFAAPKYWYYDSTKWDGSPTFYAEVTYNTIAGVASTTRYDAAGTYTYAPPIGTASTTVELIGGGGAGGGNPATANTAGAGGAGGQYAKKSVPIAGFGNHTLVVAATRAGTSNSAGSAGNDSTWDTTTVVAKGGAGGAIGVAAGVAASSTGSLTGCVGDVCYAGGNGANGAANSGGGGGSGAGTLGTGNSASVAGVAGTPRALSGGAGGAKNTGNAAGTAGSAVAGYGGGGGGGSRSTAATARAGGTGGKGTATTTSYIATTTIALQESDGTGDGFQNFTTKVTLVGMNPVATSTRIRSAAFTPTSGRNYRIAFANGKTGAKFAIYNAKIVVDQTSTPTLFETQYLLANSLFAVGTSLQNFLTYWDPSEWNTNNSYIHEGSAVSSGTSDIKLQNVAGPSDVVDSNLIDVTKREQSIYITMPGSAATLDVIAPVNNGDLTASRILVQVNTSPSSVPDAPSGHSATPGLGQVGLSWAVPNGNGAPIMRYYIYRSTSPSPTTFLATSTATTYYDRAVTNGTLYYYCISAANNAGEGACSTDVSATPTEATGSSQRSSIRFFGGRMMFLGGRVIFR